MTLTEIAAALRERERPEQDTTYWVPIALLQDLEEAVQDQYLLMESDSYHLGTPLRVDVKKYVPEIPDRSEEFKTQLLKRFLGMEFSWYPGDPNKQGFLERGEVKLRANFRTYDDQVSLQLDSDFLNIWCAGSDVAMALSALSKSIDRAEQDCRDARALLQGEPCSTK